MSTILRLVLLSAVAGAMLAQPSSTKTRDRFIGVWKLVSCQLKSANGDLSYPYGQEPVGRIAYDKAGRMSATLMRRGRPGSYTRDSLNKTSREDLAEVLRGFTAYFGTFDVDESTHTVIHHVEASIYPSNVGTDLKRTYEFAGNQLILTAVMTQGIMRLVWERLPD
ncbi:MAG TPA: lipocalin-like domain-containing protein [Bryobacteraceae bacterium]|nr:lipocalin-like domain-containing protein [Bryobacteraceae bacterium]